jgi:hypothetical protein
VNPHPVRVPAAEFLAAGLIDGDQYLDLVGAGDVVWMALSGSAPEAVDGGNSPPDADPPEPRVVINEVNREGVEIYNGTPEFSDGLQLKHILGDGVDETYVVPDRAVAPGGRIWLPLPGGGGAGAETGIRLSSNGGDLVLHHASGTEIDRVTYPPMSRGVSYQRFRDGSPDGHWVQSNTPTPGGSNQSVGDVPPTIRSFQIDRDSLAGGLVRFSAEAFDDIGIVMVSVVYREVAAPPNARLRRVELFDDGMHGGDVTMLDGIWSWTGTFAAGMQIEYYVEALDLTGAVATFPAGIGPDPGGAPGSAEWLSFSTGGSPDDQSGVVIQSVTASGGGAVILANRSPDDVDLTGWELAQQFPSTAPDTFTFPPGAALAAGASILVHTDGDPSRGSLSTPFRIDGQAGVSLFLTAPDGGARVLVDRVIDLPPLDGTGTLDRNRGAAGYRDVWVDSLRAPTGTTARAVGAFWTTGEPVWAAPFNTTNGVRYIVTISPNHPAEEPPTDFTGDGSVVWVSQLRGERSDVSITVLPAPDPGPPVLGEVSVPVPCITRKSAQIEFTLEETGDATPTITVYWSAEDHGEDPAVWDARVQAGHAMRMAPGIRGGRYAVDLSDLSEQETYYYLIVAKHSGGRDFEPGSFTTLGHDVPWIEGHRAKEPVFDTLEITIDVPDPDFGDGVPAHVLVGWGTSDGGCSDAGWSHFEPALPKIGAPGTFRATVANVQPGQVYYFRARASARDASGQVVWAPTTSVVRTRTMEELLDEFLVINELMYRPRAGGDEDEWRYEYVGLFNHGPVPLDLAGVVLKNSRGLLFRDFDLSPHRWLGPGESVYVVADRSAFDSFYRAQVPVAGSWWVPGFDTGRMDLDDDSGTAQLMYRDSGRTLFEVPYTDSSPWPMSADGRGFAISLIDPRSDPSHGSNWFAIAPTRGSGSAADVGDVGKAIESLWISELVKDGSGLEPGFEPFIELVNLGAEPIPLGSEGARVTFDGSAGDVNFSFPDGVSIGPGKRLVLVKKGRLADFQRAYKDAPDGTVAGEYAGELRERGKITLAANGIVLHTFEYGGQGWPSDESQVIEVTCPVSRPDLSNGLVWSARSTASPGEQSVAQYIAANLIVTEFRTRGSDEEYLELRWIGNGAVTLDDGLGLRVGIIVEPKAGNPLDPADIGFTFPRGFTLEPGKYYVLGFRAPPDDGTNTPRTPDQVLGQNNRPTLKFLSPDAAWDDIDDFMVESGRLGETGPVGIHINERLAYEIDWRRPAQIPGEPLPGEMFALRNPGVRPPYPSTAVWTNFHKRTPGGELVDFAKWLRLNFAPSELGDPTKTGLEADPDGDGFTNAEEYAFAGRPMVNEQSLEDRGVWTRTVNGQWEIEFRAPVFPTDLRFELATPDPVGSEPSLVESLGERHSLRPDSTAVRVFRYTGPGENPPSDVRPVIGSPIEPYLVWLGASGGSDVVGEPDGDPDGDGIANLWEFLTWGDPLVRRESGGPPELVYVTWANNLPPPFPSFTSGVATIIVVTCATTGVSFQVEWSEDCEIWARADEFGDELEQRVEDNGDGTVTRSFTNFLLNPSDQGYFRLAATIDEQDKP